MRNNSRWESWVSWINIKILWPALIDTFLILVFTIQPTIYMVINYWRKGQNAILSDALMSGDFILYSISFLSASYLVYNHSRVRESDWKDNLNKFVIAAMVITSGLYVMMKGDNLTDYSFAKWVSILSLASSLAIFARSQVLARTPATDVAEERREEQQTIEDNLV